MLTSPAPHVPEQQNKGVMMKPCHNWVTSHKDLAKLYGSWAFTTRITGWVGMREAAVQWREIGFRSCEASPSPIVFPNFDNKLNSLWPDMSRLQRGVVGRNNSTFSSASLALWLVCLLLPIPCLHAASTPATATGEEAVYAADLLRPSGSIDQQGACAILRAHAADEGIAQIMTALLQQHLPLPP